MFFNSNAITASVMAFSASCLKVPVYTIARVSKGCRPELDVKIPKVYIIEGRACILAHGVFHKVLDGGKHAPHNICIGLVYLISRKLSNHNP